MIKIYQRNTLVHNVDMYMKEKVLQYHVLYVEELIL